MKNNDLQKANILVVLALLSGCCGLAYEVLYVRALTNVLGDMFYVHAALLSTFLIGIGLGSKTAHRFVKWLWLFEIITGLFALIMPVLLRFLASQRIMADITANSWLTVLTTSAFISLPSILIGFCIPLFSAYIKVYTPQKLSFQWVYKMYNIGAFLSILAVELYVIRQFGIRVSLLIIGAVNIFIGIVLILMRLSRKPKLIGTPRHFPKTTICALILASFASAVFQMFFLKLSYLVFHPHRENFAIGLAIVMLGLFLGTLVASKTKTGFQNFLIIAAVTIGIIYFVYIPILKLFEMTVTAARGSGFLVFLHKFLFGCIFALIPMTLFGTFIPALMRTESEVAEESGFLLMISSFANAAGYLAYVFIGHPFMSNGKLLALISVLLLLASLIYSRLRWTKLQIPAVIGAVIILMFMSVTWQDRYFYLAHWVDKLRSEDKVIIYKSDAESATLVKSQRVFKQKKESQHESSEDISQHIWQDIWISYNGHPSITVQRNGVVNFAELVVGTIPALTAPTLEKAMVIGLGTGVTAGASAEIFDSADIVEINDAFCKMMPELKHANLDVQNNPSAKFHITDGRAFMVGKENKYDAIINTVSAPTYFSASKIYTIDFYERVTKALKPGGVFSTWLSPADMSKEGIMVILSALRHNFKYCEIRFLRGNYYLLVCSNEPLMPRRKFSDMVASDSKLANQLSFSFENLNLDEYFHDIRISDNIFKYFQPDVEIENTDDHPVLEFMVVRDFQLGAMGNDPFFENQRLMNIEPVKIETAGKPERFARKALIFWKLGSDFFKNFEQILMKDADRAFEFFLLSARSKLDDQEPAEAMNLFNTALNIKQNSARALNAVGEIYLKKGQLDRAYKRFKLAVKNDPQNPDAHNNTGIVLAAQGKLALAEISFNKAIEIEPNFLQAHVNLAEVFFKQDKNQLAIELLNKAFEKNKDNDPNDLTAGLLFCFSRGLKKLGKEQQAQLYLKNAIEQYKDLLPHTNPNSVELIAKLGDAYLLKEDLETAQKYYSTAIDRNPDILENHLKLISMFEISNKFQEAMKAAKKAWKHFSEKNNTETKLLEILNSKIQSLKKLQ